MRGLTTFALFLKVFLKSVLRGFCHIYYVCTFLKSVLRGFCHTFLKSGCTFHTTCLNFANTSSPLPDHLFPFLLLASANNQSFLKS